MPDAIEGLEAIEEIRRLKAQYWRFVDTKQWDRFGQLFAPDATFTDHSAAFHCDGRTEIRDKIAAALPDDVITVHHGHQSEIEIDDAEHARGIWAMEDYLIFPPGAAHPTSGAPTSTLRGYGHYVESYVKLDGAWKFQKSELFRLRLEVSGNASTGYPTWTEPRPAVTAGA
jgi:SnoaL-like domain